MSPAPQLYKTILEALQLEIGSTIALRDIMLRLFVEATKKEQIKFSTAFAKCCFIVQKYQLEGDEALALHHFRRVSRYPQTGEKAKNLAILGAFSLASLVHAMFEDENECAERSELLAAFPEKIPLPNVQYRGEKFAEKIRAVAIRDIPTDKCLVCILEDAPEEEVLVRYGLTGHNEGFGMTIKTITQVFKFPINLNLLDVSRDTVGRLSPRAFVVEPDYLLDISAVAECFKPDVIEPFSFLSYKFLPREHTLPLLLGNVANYFLDRMMGDPEMTDYRTMLKDLFREQPVPLAPLTDAEARDLGQRGQQHYISIRQMVADGFSKEGITKENSLIEPSFYSEKYGIQGRLDLFHIADDGQMSIVELKSGKPYKPNIHRISRSHYTQTLLYDMLVRSVFPKADEPKKYILYSRESTEQLRYAPSIFSEQMEAIQVRNQLLTIEYLLTQIKPGDETVSVLNRLSGSMCKEKNGFTKKGFELFEGNYHKLDPLERTYFNSFVGFIAREQWLSRVGEESPDSHQGHAALWRSNVTEKEAAFSMMQELSILENQANAEEPYIIFQKNKATNPLANFRVGDIVVAHRVQGSEGSVMTSQVLRGVLSENTSEHIRIEFRQRQSNLNAFTGEGTWTIEPDNFDSGFLAMYRGLFQWASTVPAVRQRIMGRIPPQGPDEELATLYSSGEFTTPKQLTEEQAAIFKRILASKGHFLLWGPPGTGKTSIMLRYLAEWWLRNTAENILLLAFTNRAVDEICEALNSIGGDVKEQYLRIGSKHSTGVQFRPQLLETQIAGAENRKEITELFKSKRIIVSTVSSFSGKAALMDLKKFHRVVIDEASQLLEPQLIGLLTQFPQAVLIGDHQQLPAVSTQAKEMSKVEHEALNSIGLVDLRDSYFERMYRLFSEKNWDFAFGRLSYQGRMHVDVMAFPNDAFYQGKLDVLPQNPRQNAVLPFGNASNVALHFPKISEKRVLFINQKRSIGNTKTNASEAETCVKLLLDFQKIYSENGLEWKPNTLGIITPWRAQIAQIRAALMDANIDPDSVTVDTVERYQGGARDIVLLSLCVNVPQQLQAVASLSAEGVDRKFNVALTRARQQVVVLGNAELLSEMPFFKEFIDRYNISEDTEKA